DRAQSATLDAKSAVSAGLCEMKIAMRRQRTKALSSAEHQAALRRYFADAAQRGFGKLLLETIEQLDGVAAADREEQLEIFPVSQGSKERDLAGPWNFGLGA